MLQKRYHARVYMYHVTVFALYDICRRRYRNHQQPATTSFAESTSDRTPCTISYVSRPANDIDIMSVSSYTDFAGYKYYSDNRNFHFSTKEKHPAENSSSFTITIIKY